MAGDPKGERGSGFAGPSATTSREPVASLPGAPAPGAEGPATGTGPERPIRVLLADPSRFFIAGVQRTLEQEADIEVVAAVADGEAAVSQTEDLEPDVVVLELDLPALSGDKAAQRIRRELPNVGIVVLTAEDDEQRLFTAIRSGANAYLRKDCEPAELAETIRRAREGKFLINEQVFSRPSVASRVLAEFRDLSVYGPASAHVFAPLSPREVQILDNIAQGMTNKEVAYALAISEQTVKNHMSSILRKLSVNDRTQAVVYALRQGWIQGPRVPEPKGPESKPMPEVGTR